MIEKNKTTNKLELVVATDIGNKPNNKWSVDIVQNTWVNIEISQQQGENGVH